MHHFDFFDLPVYRVPKEQYQEEKDDSIEAYINPPGDSENALMQRSFYARDPDAARSMRAHLDKAFGGMWRYNEIVGYIRMYFLGSQVRGMLFMVDVKKIMKTRKKLLVYKTDKVVYEQQLPHPRTNENIWQAILDYLDRAKRELKPRVIDTELFERIGPFVDWIGLMK